MSAIPDHIELVDAVEAFCTRCGWHQVMGPSDAWSADFASLHPEHPADPPHAS